MSTDPLRPGLVPAYSPTVRDLQRSGSLRRTVAGLLLGTALLSGCSEKTEANETLPPTSAAPTTEALPPVGPTDFPVPDEARTKDAAGAEAFLRYWIELLNHQQAIPEGQPIRLLGQECEECSRVANAFDEAAAAGQTYEGGTVTLTEVSEPELMTNRAEINFAVQVEAVSLTDSLGQPVPGGQAQADPVVGSGIALTWSSEDHAWHVDEFNLG